MMLKVPSGETMELKNPQSLNCSQLVQLLPAELRSRELIFLLDGDIINTNQSLGDFRIHETSVIYCLVKNQQPPKDSWKTKAVENLPTNLNEVVKSFRILIDQYGLPFGEKLKQMVQNTDSFNALLSSVPGNFISRIFVV